eukprot:TRINITY_DN48320_c0_g1_i1.p1 TRINITY_DN48320_c0_g1~~TRINITY_DN48320_c0_g1_i1.p1  ORF type:complete len:305 (-),score=6.00 TRINITY_DN48320_c0_g1_i1:151-969(-)
MSTLRRKQGIYRKTQLCTFWARNACQRGDDCYFAHGESDLKPAPNFWKTKMCQNYSSFGVCELGNECTYAHDVAELREEVKRNSRRKGNERIMDTQARIEDASASSRAARQPMPDNNHASDVSHFSFVPHRPDLSSQRMVPTSYMGMALPAGVGSGINSSDVFNTGRVAGHVTFRVDNVSSRVVSCGSRGTICETYIGNGTIASTVLPVRQDVRGAVTHSPKGTDHSSLPKGCPKGLDLWPCPASASPAWDFDDEDMLGIARELESHTPFES